MWHSCSLPQGTPRWVMLKGSPHSLVGKRLQEVLPSLQIHYCPSAAGQMSHSSLLQHPAGCVTWLFLSSWGGHNQYSTPFESIKKPRSRSDSCDCSDPSRQDRGTTPASGRCLSSTKSESCLCKLWYYTLWLQFSIIVCLGRDVCSWHQG